MAHHSHRAHGHGRPPRQAYGIHDQHHGLDLDAEVFDANLAAVLDLAEAPAARGVVDLGAGTGAGARLLRERYPHATVTCIDNDPQMLALLREQGFAVVEADLDHGFPALGEAPADLVWVSSALHHLAHPARLLSGVRRVLAPGGVLVVAEIAGLPRFLADPRAAALEDRCHTAAAAEGWNRYPDWTPLIEAAGFRVTASEVTTDAPVTPVARAYAQQWLARFAHLKTLAAEDRAAAQELSERAPESLELQPRATRTVWTATPTETPERSCASTPRHRLRTTPPHPPEP